MACIYGKVRQFAKPSRQFNENEWEIIAHALAYMYTNHKLLKKEEKNEIPYILSGIGDTTWSNEIFR